MEKITTQPAAEPITLAELRLQLGVMDDSATERDPVFSANIKAARIWAEWFTRRALITQTWGYYADAFPTLRRGQLLTDFIDLRLDLQSVASINYVNDAGVLTTLDPANYQVDLISSRVLPAYGLSWPTTRAVPNAVQISYVSGYANAAAVPEDIKKALKIIAGQWENFQSALESGITVRTIAYAAIQLLAPYKDYRNLF